MSPMVFGALTRIDAMLAAFATIAFLATLWMLGVFAVTMFVQNSAKIVAALGGRSLLATATAQPPIVARVSQRSRLQRPVRAQPQLCVAA